MANRGSGPGWREGEGADGFGPPFSGPCLHALALLPISRCHDISMLCICSECWAMCSSQGGLDARMCDTCIFCMLLPCAYRLL
jgi:hypothetical protein